MRESDLSMYKIWRDFLHERIAWLRLYRGWNAWNIHEGQPFNLICLIKFVSIASVRLFLRRNEIIPKSHRSPTKAHSLESEWRGRKESRMGSGEPFESARCWNSFSFLLLFPLPSVNLTRMISSSSLRWECFLWASAAERPRRALEARTFSLRSSSWKNQNIRMEK